MPMDKCLRLRFLPYQALTMARDTTTELNIEVKIPKQCTTANPLTGPAPLKINKARPAIKEVTLESKIVPQANS